MTVSDDRGRPVAAPGLAAWLRRVAPARARGAVNIALVSDARIRALNRTYRGSDRVTDVLSFDNRRAPGNPHPAPRQARRALSRSKRAIRTPQLPEFLGDIAIARGAARRQARAAQHSASTELRVLALHGLLHLIGYDHERDNGEMRRVEERLRRRGGLRVGLIERTQP